VRVIRGFEGWPARPLHLAIGAFDGVHLGHQALVKRLCDGARADRALAVTASFDRLPIEILAPTAAPSALSDATERAELLTAAGADAVVLFRSDPALFAMSAREFVDRVQAAGEIRRIVVGPDFRFGHDREGDVGLLAVLGKERGFAVDIVPSTLLGGEVIGSTRIRDLLVAGDVRGAARFLGRPYPVRGRIMHADDRGRALGYPTISVATPRERLLPRDGVYATWVTVAGTRHAAATSLSVRPLRRLLDSALRDERVDVGDGGQRILESYVPGLAGDPHDGDVTVAFVERLRDVLHFGSAQASVRQIAHDIDTARRALAAENG